MPIDPNDPRAPYLQIADDLRHAITAGELKPGERLEPGRKLAQRYGVSPMTVQQAVRELRTEGLVVTWQGRGAFVRGGESGDGDSASQEDSAARINRQLEAMHDLLADLETRVAHLESGSGNAPARRREK